MKSLEILYHDPYFIAIHKPAGLMVHRSPVAQQETQFALQMLRDQIGRWVFPVHRLDRPTAGVLLFALCPQIAQKTSELFQIGEIQKKYIAVVRGYLPKQGIIDHPLKKINDRRIHKHKKQKYTEKNIYPAVTTFKRLARIELPVHVDKYPCTRYSLAALFPKTGRRHQLRRHMKHLSHPIIGDTRYGKNVHNRFFIEQFQCRGLLLSAVELCFLHPETGAKVRIRTSPGRNLSLILNQFQWNYEDISPVFHFH